MSALVAQLQGGGPAGGEGTPYARVQAMAVPGTREGAGSSSNAIKASMRRRSVHSCQHLQATPAAAGTHLAGGKGVGEDADVGEGLGFRVFSF